MSDSAEQAIDTGAGRDLTPYLVVVGMVLMLFEAFGETMLDGDAT